MTTKGGSKTKHKQAGITGKKSNKERRNPVLHQGYVIYKKLRGRTRGEGGGLWELPGCLDYLAGTEEGVKDECETKRWKNRAEVSIITGTGRDTVRR